MVLRRRPLDRAGLARLLWAHPLMTTRVSGGIYAQALRLVARRAPIHRAPRAAGWRRARAAAVAGGRRRRHVDELTHADASCSAWPSARPGPAPARCASRAPGYAERTSRSSAGSGGPVRHGRRARPSDMAGRAPARLAGTGRELRRRCGGTRTTSPPCVRIAFRRTDATARAPRRLGQTARRPGWRRTKRLRPPSKQRRPAQHRRPLRPLERLLRPDARPDDGVLVRLLRRGRDTSLEAAQVAKFEMIAAKLRPGPRGPRDGDRHRLGRVRDPRRRTARLPRHHDHDLRGPAFAWQRSEWPSGVSPTG